jgi:very-short-patch-repair endonuclease
MQEDGGLRMGSALYVKFCKAAGLPEPIPEFRFHPTRKWRFDYCWVDQKVALEVDGGIWTHGRHTRGAGWLKDAEKLNTAAAMGWRLLRCTPDQLASQEMLDLIKQALSQESAA